MNAITFLCMVGAIWYGIGWTLGSIALNQAHKQLKEADHPILTMGLTMRCEIIKKGKATQLLRCIGCLIVGVAAHLIVR